MSYHSYVKNRGEKKGVRKDRIYTKHGLLNGRLIRPAKIPSLSALAARKLPDTKDWKYLQIQLNRTSEIHARDISKKVGKRLSRQTLSIALQIHITNNGRPSLNLSQTET